MRYERSKAKCPYCPRVIWDLPRHLRLVHKISKSHAKAARCNFGIRKRWVSKNPESKSESSTDKPKRKRQHLRRLCKFPGCSATPRRIHNHLRACHKLSLNSEAYRHYLKEAIILLPDNEEPEEQMEAFSEEEDLVEKNGIDDGEKEHLKEIRVNEKQINNIAHNIYDSEEDEDFVLENEDDDDCDEDEVDENEEDEKENEGQGEIRRGNEEVEFVLKEFCDWLESDNGGERKITDAEQAARKVRVILEHVDSEGMSVGSLADRIKVRSLWLVPFKNSKRKPGTVRSYVNALRLFFEFIEVTKVFKIPLSDIRAMQTQCRTWSRSLDKISRKREFEKAYEDLEHMFDPDEAVRFDSSKPCREAVSIIEMFSVPKLGFCPTQQQYTLTRDFLLWNLSIENGGRPGPFVDMTLNQFITATKKTTTDENGMQSLSYVIPIFDHKTDYAHGPAQVVFREVLYNWFKIFIENIRGKFYGLPLSGDSPVFVTHTGNRMESRNISGRLTSIWGKGMEKKGGKKMKMSNTLIRKSVTTQIHKHHQDLIDPVAAKLLHNVKTAKRFYNVVRKGDDAVETTNKICQIFKGYSGTQKNNGATFPEDADNDSNNPTSSSRIKWNESDIDMLKVHFSDCLQANSITMGVVSSRLNEINELKKFNGYEKKVLDKLRYINSTKQSKIDTATSEFVPNESFSEKMVRNGLSLEVRL